MLRTALIPLILAVVVALPFALRPRDNLLAEADETLVLISPHNEAIRSEFARGFREWYHAKTGRTARLDWRVPGGTSEIARYLAGEFQAPFENHWKNRLGRPWTATVQRAFADSKIQLGRDPARDSEAEAARRAFLESDVGIGIDLFFGGGSFDFIQQANAGRLVDSGFVRAHPELFGTAPGQIPPSLGGEPFYDPGGRWFGTVLSAFGICYNVEAIERAGPDAAPRDWQDLAAPRFLGRVALADPNQSGSVAKAFEMIIQQAMQRSVAAGVTTSATGSPAVVAGWEQALRTIQKMGANARYFTDSATKVPIDVAEGDAAVGMCIDFYGRFESENARRASESGEERMRYFNPPGGTSIGVDPIALLRGAPHRALALAFMEYVLSLEGQKLWNWKVGAPGGPQQYALRRLPIRPELYAPEFAALRADPEVFPYEEAKSFNYHPEWTGHLFNPIRFIVRVLCVESHEEARAAWAALIHAGFPAEATRTFEDVSAVSYPEAEGRIREALRHPDRIVEAQLAAELTAKFRAQYRRAAALAEAGQ